MAYHQIDAVAAGGNDGILVIDHLADAPPRIPQVIEAGALVRWSSVKPFTERCA
jgi:hypothetical protein